jgi:aldose 1-epimerase
MTVTREVVSGIEVIDIALPGIRVSLLSLGAAIHGVEVPDASGILGPVHLALPEVGDYAETRLNPHLGATVGRYANRIAGGRFTLDGVEHVLDVNNGPNTLHGGHQGFDRLPWAITHLEDGDTSAAVTFALHSPDGDMGFPGAMDARVTYRVTGGSIAVHMSATCDAPTVVSLANHGYWNLDGTSSIAEHRLDVPAGQRLHRDATGIPSGIAEVAGTPYDLRSAPPLGAVIAATGGLDDCYLPEGEGMRTMATLRGATSGRSLTVISDAPGLQVYTGNSLREPFTVHQTVSLEAQRLPDAPNQPALGACVLRPGQTYTTTTVLDFTV